MYFNAENPEHQHTLVIDLSTGERSTLCVLECDTDGNWLRVMPHPFRPSDTVPAQLPKGFSVVDAEGKELARSPAAPSVVHMWADLNSEDEAEREITCGSTMRTVTRSNMHARSTPAPVQ